MSRRLLSQQNGRFEVNTKGGTKIALIHTLTERVMVRYPHLERRRLPVPIFSIVSIFIHSNIFIALAATSVAVSTILLVGQPLDPIPLFIVFAATLFVYSINRLTDIEEDAKNVPHRAAFTNVYGRKIFLVGIGLYLIAIIIGIGYQLPMVEFLVVPVLFGFTYSMYRLKRLLLVKNMLVGIGWGVIPLGVGVYYDVLWSIEIFVMAGFIAVMLTIAAALFDIKDIAGDRASGIRTGPVVYGSQLTRQAAAVSTVCVGLFILLALFLGLIPTKFILLLGHVGYLLASIPFASTGRSALFYGGVIDGEHIFLACLIAIATMLI